MNQKLQSKIPVIYEAIVKPRFNDFDPYGHVNSSCYLDYVISSRWDYTQKHFKFGPQEFIDQGIGFYLLRSEFDFKKSITAKHHEVFVSSFVSDKKMDLLYIDFSIQDINKTVTFSSGKLVFAVIDLTTKKKSPLPEKFEIYFWK